MSAYLEAIQLSARQIFEALQACDGLGSSGHAIQALLYEAGEANKRQYELYMREELKPQCWDSVLVWAEKHDKGVIIIERGEEWVRLVD